MEWGYAPPAGSQRLKRIHHTRGVETHDDESARSVMHAPGTLFQSSLTCKAPCVSDL